ncbi:hypothetical protein AGR7A_Cc120194 [Agrobacterium deltaense NCPPB 1641]|uniref:Uncharacterized protein n=1 Tax=Agrobacterium deltaense NCPPB 1641 TaxID=1183425 RepID=A0A1S7TJF2_9HYPH|nr:hypothetical protein AGR7A_Cc120194 [Agrobacterium deltaense NCPPB 1641]
MNILSNERVRQRITRGFSPVGVVKDYFGCGESVGHGTGSVSYKRFSPSVGR